MWLAWIGASWASPGSSGAVHLGAEPLERGASFAGAGVGFGWSLFAGAAVVPMIEGGAATGERSVVTAQVGALPSYTGAVPALVSARYLLADTESVHFGVSGNLSVFPFVNGDPAQVHLDPGLVLETGGDWVRFDAAVPLWGVSSAGRYVGFERYPVPLYSTIGVSFLQGEHHRVRVGLPELLSYHYRGEHTYFDVGGGTILLAGVAFTKIGWVF